MLFRCLLGLHLLPLARALNFPSMTNDIFQHFLMDRTSERFRWHLMPSNGVCSENFQVRWQKTDFSEFSSCLITAAAVRSADSYFTQTIDFISVYNNNCLVDLKRRNGHYLTWNMIFLGKITIANGRIGCI